MAEFEFLKDMGDIEEPILLSEDWYTVKVVDQPKVEKNAAARDGKSYEDGAGMNLEIPVRVISDIPEESGRSFRLYIPFPVEEDLGHYDSRGQLKYDAKMERIKNFCESFSRCQMEGNKVSIPIGAVGMIYITQGMDRNGRELTNSFDLFSGFKPAQTEGAIEAGLDGVQDDENIPF
ncbi:MAG: hypothetical protein JRJ69_17655 [Deltaproteobacteria bacterium]|nr:hypothetical protein [Deltaproteobacteria bacterium]